MAAAVFVDDVFLIGKSDNALQKVIKELRQKFAVADEGAISTYLGISVDQKGNKFVLRQPTLIQKILTTIPGRDHGTSTSTSTTTDEDTHT